MLRTIRTTSAHLSFDIEYGPIRVEAGVSQFVEIDLSTRDADDSDSAKAIAKTNVHELNNIATVTVPALPPVTGSVHGVTFGRHGGVQVTNVRGNMSIVGNRVFVDGREIKPGANDGTAQHGIEVVIRIPRASNLTLKTLGSDLTHVGDPLGVVNVKSQSGSVTMRDAEGLRFISQSGSVEAQNVVQVKTKTQSGSAYIRSTFAADMGTMSGSIEILGAQGDVSANSMSGSVSITALTAGSVEASTMSGNVTVYDPNRLHRRGLDIEMSSMSGRTAIR